VLGFFTALAVLLDADEYCLANLIQTNIAAEL
jgi:hypothetical protein